MITSEELADEEREFIQRRCATGDHEWCWFDDITRSCDNCGKTEVLV